MSAARKAKNLAIRIGSRSCDLSSVSALANAAGPVMNEGVMNEEVMNEGVMNKAGVTTQEIA
ncbi:MAG: hypothetical protein OSA47_10485, partial [Novosphingopyxis baekryungensis]|nr:hypothetical protein [Novosphingopyxis baekryungensis]